LSTLVVSDLHLGSRAEADVAGRPEVRADLRAALADVERLVLLGDLLELRHGPVREALAAAEGLLGDVGAAMAGREVVLVPGNHDHQLAMPWLERRRREARPPPLGLAQAVDAREDEPLGHVVARLAPARVRVAYPGLWLRDDVWATHGHYLDLHFTVPTFERLASGVMRRIVGALPAEGARPDDYERVLAPSYAWLYAMAQLTPEGGGVPGRQRASSRVWRRLSRGSAHRPLRSWLLRTGFGATIATLNHAGIGPLRADVSGHELRRAGLRAMAEALGRLRVGATHVIFGHTHRSGPWPRDDVGEWRPAGGPALWNAGTWVWEPGFVTRTPNESPYWPGAAIRLGPEGEPRPVRLLGAETLAAFTRARA
jgi:calcineurin-like phosphoesterase family protein